MYIVLVVEDPLADGSLMSQALHDLPSLIQVHTVRDGIQAIAFLRQAGPYAHVPRPDIIILDVSRSPKHGQALLAEITQDPRWRRIPLIFLPSSLQPVDTWTVLQRGRTAARQKPPAVKKGTASGPQA
jgi:two-component system, chemotaxis family, response regulator Rcp1